MRRADVLIAVTLFASALALAPLIHTHVDGIGHQACSLKCPAGPMPHVHFPGDRGACPADGANHAERDHTSPAAKPLHLLANLTTGAFRIFVNVMATTPAPLPSPPGPGRPVSVPATLAAREQPPTSFLAFRAPPVWLSI